MQDVELCHGCDEENQVSLKHPEKYELSRPLDKIFVEEERGFRVIENNFAHCSLQASQGHRILSAVEFAVKAENCFHTFSYFCHGLLAGITLWQCVTVYQLSIDFKFFDFVMHYGFQSQPFQTLLFFLCVICTVSTFDKFCIANAELSAVKQLFLKAHIIVIFLYPLCLLFSVSIHNVDDAFYLSQFSANLQNSSDIQVLSQEFGYWKSLNTARCFFAIMGWIAVAILSKGVSLGHQLRNS